MGDGVTVGTVVGEAVEAVVADGAVVEVGIGAEAGGDSSPPTGPPYSKC